MKPLRPNVHARGDFGKQDYLSLFFEIPRYQTLTMQPSCLKKPPMSEIVEYSKTSCEAVLASFRGNKPPTPAGAPDGQSRNSRPARRRVFRRLGSVL